MSSHVVAMNYQEGLTAVVIVTVIAQMQQGHLQSRVDSLVSYYL